MMTAPEAQGVQGAVVLSNGARPSPLQRSQIQERFGEVHTAVLTDSVVTRGAVTALRWFGIPVRAFRHADTDSALRFAGVPPQDVDQVRHMLTEMSARLAAA